MSEPGQDRRSELFAHASRGDGAALDDLLVHYLPRLEAFVRAQVGANRIGRESCADVVQSVCREVVGRRQVFEFQGEAAFRSWLFTATLNKIRSKHRFHRAERRDVDREEHVRDTRGAEELIGTPDHGASPSRAAGAREELTRLVEALERLTPDHREVISLARIAELPLPAVAEQMERSVPATRQLLARALIKLAAAFEEPGQSG